MTSDELNAIKARNAARTPGKWAESFRGCGIDVYQAGGMHIATLHWGEPSLLHSQRERDAQFIAACSEDVPALIAEMERLCAENERLRASQREAEDQLCRIASCLGTDARDAPEGDRTIAGLAITAVKRLREALTWAVGYIRCQRPHAEADYPDMRNAVDLMRAAPINSGEFHRMMCCASLAEEEVKQLKALLALAYHAIYGENKGLLRANLKNDIEAVLEE